MMRHFLLSLSMYLEVFPNANASFIVTLHHCNTVPVHVGSVGAILAHEVYQFDVNIFEVKNIIDFVISVTKIVI